MLFFVSILYPILFIISRFDLGFHPAINIDLIIKGVFISAFFTMLFYLLDMIPKKMFLFFLGIQYVLVIIFGTKTFTLFVLYFIFQNLLIFSYGLKKEKPYDFITTPDNRIHYLVPGIISLLILFVGEKYNSQVWPFLAVSISFSIYSLYHHGLWQGFIRPRLSNKSLWTMHLTHFLFFNSILIVFFILLKVLSVMGFGTILPLLLAANITAGAYYYFTYVKKRDSLFGPLADTLLFSILPVFLMFTIQQLFNTLK